MIYGLQTGAIYDVTKNIQFEFGGFYSKYRKNIKTNGLHENFSYTDNIKIKSSNSIYLGLNYKF